ncbi:MAG: CoA transferase [Deltaproteobacteria bacterium]|nr:CoA transferase [Deltaproteobacteria bacterium]
MQIWCIESDRYWKSFCNALSLGHIKDDPKFNSHKARLKNSRELVSIIEEAILGKTYEELEKCFEEAGEIIFSRVQRPLDIVNDPQAEANGFFHEIEHSTGRKLRLIASPARFSDTPAAIKKAAPALGQDTEQILSDAGYDKSFPMRVMIKRHCCVSGKKASLFERPLRAQERENKMIMDSITLCVMIVIFFSAVVRAAFGFGEALIAMPLLALIIDIKLATPLMALVGTSIALVIILKSWKEVDFAEAKRLVLSSVLGVPLGIFLLKDVYSGLIKIILAVVIISFSVYKLIQPEIYRTVGKRSGYVYGFFAGILGGAYNTSGPPVIIYGTLRRWSPHEFRATLQGYFIPTGLFVLMGHCLSGLWTSTVFQLYLISIPIVALAIATGFRINRVVSGQKFDRYIHMFLIVIGIILLVDSTVL